MDTQTKKALAKIDSVYKQWQDYAKTNGYEQLLAKAVVWSYDYGLEDEYSTDEDRWQMARRAIAMQTTINDAEGFKPEELWAALVARAE